MAAPSCGSQLIRPDPGSHQLTISICTVEVKIPFTRHSFKIVKISGLVQNKSIWSVQSVQDRVKDRESHFWSEIQMSPQKEIYCLLCNCYREFYSEEDKLKDISAIRRQRVRIGSKLLNGLTKTWISFTFEQRWGQMISTIPVKMP